MAFSKTPTKVTTIKEYGNTTAPDSAYPLTSKNSQNNNSSTDAYIATGDNLRQSSQEDGSEAKPLSSSPNKNWSSLKFIIEILVGLITIGGLVWFLAKFDSKIDNVDNKVETVAKDLEKNTSKIDGLKEKVSEITFKIQGLEQKNLQKNISTEGNPK
jgi:hypothetical protein